MPDDANPHVIVATTFPSKNLQSVLLTHPQRDNCLDPSFELVAFEDAVTFVDDRPGVLFAARPAGEKPISVTYKVTPKLRDYDFHIADVASCDPVVLSAQNFFADGPGLFLRARPTNLAGEPFTIGAASVVFRNAPAAWSLDSSLAGGDLKSGVHLDAYERLFGALFIGGGYDAAYTPAGDVTVSSFSASQTTRNLAANVREAISKAIPYFGGKWGALNAATHSVFLVPTVAGGDSFGGLVAEQKTDAQYIVYSASADIDDIVQSAIHELAHLWVGRATHYQHIDFIREGLTEYVSQKAVYDLKLADADRMIWRANLALQNIASGGVPQLAEYDEGFLMALALDAKSLETEGRATGLDAVLVRLFADTSGSGSETAYFRLVREAGLFPDDAAPDASSISLPCEFQLDRRTWRLMSGVWPSYDAGYAKNDANVIESVKPDSNAYRAGLRAGDTLVAMESEGTRSIHAPLVLKIRGEDGADRVISYEPFGPPVQTVYAQFVDVDATPVKGATVSPSTACRTR